MSRLFFLEDDPVLGSGISLQLELERYEVIWSQSLLQAKEAALVGSFDLFILDVNLPDGSGFDFCRWMREKGIEAPVIFLTAKTDEDSVVEGFNLGASDYIRKPFGKNELMARVRNQLSEKRQSPEILRYGDLTLILDQQALKFKEDLLSLNRREFEILKVFFERPETIVTRESLLTKITFGEEIFDRTLDSHISHIRSKLRKKGIEEYRINSVYGSGYRLEKV